MDVRDASGQRSLKLRWLRPDYSLSSGLCHGRCACMAGHQNLNKKYLFCGPEGRSHGSCPGSPLLSVVLVCVGIILRFCCLLLELTLSIHRICILNQPQLKITVPINQSTCSSRKIAYWWVTWYARNHFLFKRKKLDPLISTAKAEAVVEAFRRYKKPEHQQRESTKAEGAKQWKPPPKNWYKVNVDAAIDNQRQRVGLGVVVRNDNGDIVAAAIKLSTFNGEVSFAEAEAIEWGMQVARSAGITSVIFESDCQVAVDLANNRKGSKTEIFWVISDIKSRKKDFQEVKFQHTPRSGNVNAHTLAKIALKGAESVVWLGNIPAQILCLFSSY